MTIAWYTLVFIHCLSVGFLGLCLMRLFGFLRRHKLKETSYSLLWGFIRLEYVVAAYILFVAAYTFGSIFFVLSLSV